MTNSNNKTLMNLANYIILPKEWKVDLDKQLNDKTIKSNYSDLKLDKSFGEEFDCFALSLDFESSGKIAVFNDSNDKDELDNVDPNQLKLYDNKKAMLRYDLLAQLKAAAGFSFGKIGFEFDADQSLRLSYYRIHENSIKFKDAINNDIASFKLIYSSNHIKTLETNEALAVEFFGTINAGLVLSISDAYSGTLSALGELLPDGTGISGECELGASLSFSIGIKDKFKAFIQKQTNDEFKVIITKAVTSTKSASIKAEFSAQLNDPDKLDENLIILYNKLHEAVLGNKVEELDDIINKKIDNLGDLEKKALNALIKRMGWEPDAKEKGLIQEKYNKIKTDIIKKATEVLKNKLELSVSFEYKQIDSSNTLFEALITKEAIDNNLRNILLYKTDQLVKKDGVTIKKYLFEKSKEITSKFGFALQFGKFKYFWFNMNSYKEQVTHNYINNKKKIVFSPQRTHEHESLNHKKWYINLNAQMEEPQETPRMNDFDFELNLHWEDREKKTKKEELVQFVDMGVIWNSIPENEFDKTVEQIAKLTFDKKDVTYSCHFMVPLGILDKMMDKIANPNEIIVLDSLSEAIPYKNYNFRKTPSLRRIVYHSIWKTYLDKKPTGFKQFATACGDYIQAFDKDLADWEGSFANNSTTMDDGFQSFTGLIEYNYLYNILRSLKNGALYYDTAMDKNKVYSFKKMKKAFKKIDDILHTNGTNKLFNLNFLARYLFNIARELGLSDELESISTVEYTDDKGKEQKLTFTKSS